MVNLLLAFSRWNTADGVVRFLDGEKYQSHLRAVKVFLNKNKLIGAPTRTKTKNEVR